MDGKVKGQKRSQKTAKGPTVVTKYSQKHPPDVSVPDMVCSGTRAPPLMARFSSPRPHVTRLTRPAASGNCAAWARSRGIFGEGREVMPKGKSYGLTFPFPGSQKAAIRADEEALGYDRYKMHPHFRIVNRASPAGIRRGEGQRARKPRQLKGPAQPA